MSGDGELELKCFQFQVNEACQGVTLDFTYPVYAIEIFVDELVDAATFILTIAFKTLAADMSVNAAKGLNAFRCAINSIFTNVSNLALGIYYVLLEYDMAYLIKDEVIDAFYPNVCTCTQEIEAFGDWIMGASEDQENNGKYIGVCSEAAAQNRDSQAAQEEPAQA